MNKTEISLIFFVVFISVPKCYGLEFIYFAGTTARNAGLSDTGGSLLSGCDSIGGNPAGIVYNNTDRELSLTYGQAVENITSTNLTFVSSIDNNQSFGLSFVLLDSGDIRGYNSDRQLTNSYRLYNTAFALLYARNLMANFSSGILLRFLTEKLDDDIVLGLSTDIGIRYNYSTEYGKILFSFTIDNIGQMFYPLITISTYNICRLGAGISLYKDKLNLTTEIMISKYGISQNFATEIILYKLISFRCGYKNDEKNIYQSSGLTFGIGFVFNIGKAKINLDYSFIQNANFYTSNKLTLSTKY